MNHTLSMRAVGALLTVTALAALTACDDGNTADTSTPTTAVSTTLPTTEPVDSTPATDPTDSTDSTDSTDDGSVPTSEPTPTMAPAIPEEELPGRLLEVFTNNFGDANFAFCVQQAVLRGLEDGAIAPVDIDNYVRNLVTDPMRDLLLQIQNDASCSA